jgi:hypothetical protein
MATIGVLSAIGIAGLYGALGGERTAVAALFEGPSITAALLTVTAIGILLFRDADRLPAPRLWLAAFGFSLAIAITAAELRQVYPAGTPHDFRHEFAAFHSKNFNLTESLLMAQNFMRGRGITLPVAGGSTEIDTYRMPGYPLFVAVAAMMFRASPDDLTAIGASVVYLQVLTLAAAVAFFAHQVSRSMSIGMAALLAAVACWLPQSLDMTESDSTILACGLLIAGALCVFHADRVPSKVPLKYHLMLHTAFAAYFLMRSEVAVGWAGVGLFLYRKQLAYLALPLCFALAIGVSWGLYKKAHGSDFVMTTSNVGHVAFVGLWQTPHHKFVWEPSDESYLRWINAYGYKYMEPRANGFAFREVARFWFTYPGYVVSNAWYKAYSYFRYEAWSGSLALYPSKLAGFAMRRLVSWLLFLVVVLALVRCFDARRTFLLAWPLFLNLPIFMLVQHNARYVSFISCSLMFASIPLLLSPEFYAALGSRKRQSIAVLVVGTLVWISAPAIQLSLLSDRFRYWAPLLDPADSTLTKPR